MLDRFTAACQVNAELAPALPVIQQARKGFEDQCEQSGESAEGSYLRVANIAQQFGLADEHRAMSSFLSKLKSYIPLAALDFFHINSLPYVSDNSMSTAQRLVKRVRWKSLL